MKNRILTIILKFLFHVFPAFFFLFSINISLAAGPFLKIEKIDDTQFPKIKVFLSVSQFDKSSVTEIDEEDIRLYEDGYLVNYVRIKNISESENFLYLVIAIDTSKSISPKFFKEIKKSSNEFLGKSSADLIALYRFNDQVILLNNFTKNHSEIVKKINEIERHGSNTLLYNALFDSIDLLNKSEYPNKAVIVFTDGKDEGSSVELDDVITFSKDTKIPIYSIAFDPRENRKILSRLSMLTGGELFIFNKDKDLSSIHNYIINKIKNQFVVEYNSMLEPDGKTHKIEARLKFDNIRDREQKEITLKKRFSIKRIFSTPESIITALVTAIIVLILIIITFICRTPAGYSAKEPPLKKEENDSEEYAINDTDKKISTSLSPKDKTEKETVTEEIPLKAWLVERDGINAGKKYPVKYEETIVGRNKDNQVLLEDKSIAGKHAKIKFIKNSFYLFDMASGKDTYLNEKKLLRPKLLYDWDEIKLGKKVFIFRISNIV